MIEEFGPIQECLACGKKFKIKDPKCKYTLAGVMGEDNKDIELPGIWSCSEECSRVTIADFIEMIESLKNKS